MSTLDVVAYAGERHGGVRPANFLDIGGGASAEVMANGLEIILGDPSVRSVLVNVFGGITACDAVANGIVQAFAPADRPRRGGHAAAGRPAGRQQRRGGPAHPHRGRAARARAGGHDGRRRASASRSWREHADVDLPRRELQDHRPGHDRLGGHASTPAGWSPRARNVVGGVNPRKAGEQVDGHPGVRLGRRRDEGDRRGRVGGLRAAAVRQGRGGGGDRRRRYRWCVVITEGIPVHDTAAFFTQAQRVRRPPGWSARTAPA